MSYADDLKIFMNILAQSPDGMSDPQLVNKFAKAKSMLNGLQSMNQMQAQNIVPPIPPQVPPQVTPQEGQPPMEGTATSTPQGSEMPPEGTENPIL